MKFSRRNEIAKDEHLKKVFGAETQNDPLGPELREEIVFVVSETGGKCGTKKARPDLLPWDVLRQAMESRADGVSSSMSLSILQALQTKETAGVIEAIYQIDFVFDSQWDRNTDDGVLCGFSPRTLYALSEVYGAGAEKYGDNNWRLGYDEKLSWAKIGRHFLQSYLNSIDDDPATGTGCFHLMCVLWHLLAILYFRSLDRSDDQPKVLL